MLGNHLLLPISFLDAALAANQTFRIKLPFGVTLEGVNAAAANTEWLVSVDYDGGDGGDAADVSITLILTEG